MAGYSPPSASLTHFTSARLEVAVLAAVDAQDGSRPLEAAVGKGGRLFCTLRELGEAQQQGGGELPGVRTTAVSPNRGLPFWNQSLMLVGGALCDLKVELWITDLTGYEVPLAIGGVSAEPAMKYGRDDVSINLVDRDGNISVHIDLIIMCEEAAVHEPTDWRTTTGDAEPCATWDDAVAAVNIASPTAAPRGLQRVHSHQIEDLDHEEEEEGGAGSSTARWWSVTAAQHNPYTAGDGGADSYAQEYVRRASIGDHYSSKRVHIGQLLRAEPVGSKLLTRAPTPAAPFTTAPKMRSSWSGMFQRYRTPRAEAAPEPPALQPMPSWATTTTPITVPKEEQIANSFSDITGATADTNIYHNPYA